MGACLHACLPHHALNLTKAVNSERRGFKDNQVPKSPVKTCRVFGKLPNTAEGSINLRSDPHSADKYLNYLAPTRSRSDHHVAEQSRAQHLWDPP